MGSPSALLGGVALGVAGGLLLFVHLNSNLKESYMDEIFHVPQAQAYCRQGWLAADYDPLLTTPPGLYWTSTLFIFSLVKILSSIPKSLFSQDSATWLSPDLLVSSLQGCPIPALRLVNLLYGLGTLILLHAILVKLSWDHSPSWVKLATKDCQKTNALITYLFPVSFFFHFLYYTDSGSTFWVLLALHQASSSSRYLSSALVSLFFH